MLVARLRWSCSELGIDRCGTRGCPLDHPPNIPQTRPSSAKVRRVVTEPVTIPELCSVVDWPGKVDPRVKEESSWMLGLACQPRSPTPREERLWNGRGGPRRPASAPWALSAALSTRTTTT